MRTSHPAPAVGTTADPPWWVTAVVIIGALAVLTLTVGALFAFVLSASRLFGQPLWRVAAWRDSR